MIEYIERIKSKYGYNDELLEFLSQLIAVLIKYYGETYKDIILMALQNCEIHIQSKDENTENFLNSYFDDNKKWEIPHLGGAFHYTKIKVIDNQVISKSIIYIRTIHLFSYIPFDFNDDKDILTLIHEICHAIKEYGKLKLKKGKIINSSGLIKYTYSYTKETGVVLEKCDMKGIEEALNTVEEKQIFEMMTGRKAKNKTGYNNAAYYAERLLKHKDLAKILKNSQFSGDDSWIQYLGDEQSKILIDNFDTLVNSMYVSIRDILNKEKREMLYQKKKIAEDVLDDFINNYCSKEDVEAFTQSLDIADKKTVEMIQQLPLIKKEDDISSSIKR